MLVNWSDIIDGEIVNAAWAVVGMLAKPHMSRQTKADLNSADWAKTERAVKEALAVIAADPDLPEMSESTAAELEVALKVHDVQGALQLLLAARLTDAPETDAIRAREAVTLALTRALKRPLSGAKETAGPAELAKVNQAVRYAELLSKYFDEKVSGLVERLRGKVGFAGLAQVRAEAYNARIVALLGAIEQQVEALRDSGRGERAEDEWIDRYRRQAKARHGYIYPPDFDRRRKVAISKIYINTPIVEHGTTDAKIEVRYPSTELATTLSVMSLATLANRTVLLGDPGGGKTTATHVLANHFVSKAERRIPFIVTLREYATKAAFEPSIAEYIEQVLKAVYQSPAPDGTVERLLVTGRAVVIFDGLDELLDTSRRRDISERVEQFCTAYPLTPVLVTSRIVGYNQARLDETQFTCYRLSGFNSDRVVKYARKWFASQEESTAAEAKVRSTAFITESESVKDLRVNPLLLSLLCILYRGAGSLPRDRAAIYARCAELMLRKWDEQRDLYRKLDADHLVEPTLRYLAWWMFTRDDGQTAATERELVSKAAEFLYGRGFEIKERAYTAAGEFISFCRGRIWVFSDVGSTSHGESLYGFTHRTFLEYFAAAYLAATRDTPEELALTLIEHAAWSTGWGLVGELAIKIKSDVTDRGADRIYDFLLDFRKDSNSSPDLFEFLARCLDSALPSPVTVRNLIKAAIGYTVQESRRESSSTQWSPASPITALLRHGGDYTDIVTNELWKYIGSIISDSDINDSHNGVLFVLNINLDIFDFIINGRPLADDSHFREVGTKLTVRRPPWAMVHASALKIRHPSQESPRPSVTSFPKPDSSTRMSRSALNEISYLGFAGIMCLVNELYRSTAVRSGVHLPVFDSILPQPLNYYVACRRMGYSGKLPDLPVPDGSEQIFLDWAEGRVSFLKITEG